MIKTSCMLMVLLGCIAIAHSQNTYNEVSLPELMRLKQSGKDIVILDVRSDGEFYDAASRNTQYNIGRIKDAIHLNVQTLDEDSNAVHTLDAYKDRDVYVICSHSYRSRVASNILMQNGFKHVSNVRGGMTEWFRRYEELAPYRNEFYQANDKIPESSAAQLYTMLKSAKKPLMIGIRNTPHFFYDSLNVIFAKLLPEFTDARNFSYADSLQLYSLAKSAGGRPIVLYNQVNSGAAELCTWLTAKGIPNVSLLIGGRYYFCEYAANASMGESAGGLMKLKSRIEFITPTVYCRMIRNNEPVQLIDLRVDSVFNTVSPGTKHDFSHLKSAANFFADKGSAAFQQLFPDKKRRYVLISQYGMDGLELADELTRAGYTISWIMGGISRWEWYMNNIEDFACNDQLVN